MVNNHISRLSNMIMVRYDPTVHIGTYLSRCEQSLQDFTKTDFYTNHEYQISDYARYKKETYNMPAKKLNLQPRRKETQQIYSFYTVPQFDTIRDIYNTYNNRGGELEFTPFAMIPINKDPGDMTNEHGEWTKFIRNRLAHEWDSMKTILSI